MAVDRRRLNEYLRELAAYLDAVDPRTARRALRGALLDLLARDEIDVGAPGELEAAVRRLLGPEYAALVADVEARYDDLVELQNALYSDLGVTLRRDALQIRALEQAASAEIGGYAEDAVREVARRVRVAVLDGDDYRQLARRLSGISDRVDRHRVTLAKTSLADYSRSLKVTQAEQAGIALFEYAGFLTAGTRPFCAGHLGRIIHIDNVQRMRNGNREPVIQHCGGWNCRHVWEPDPFATGQTPGLRYVEFGEGRATVRGYTDEAGAALLAARL